MREEKRSRTRQRLRADFIYGLLLLILQFFYLGFSFLLVACCILPVACFGGVYVVGKICFALQYLIELMMS